MRGSQFCQGTTHALPEGGFVVDAGETHPDFKLATVVPGTQEDRVHARIQCADYDEGRPHAGGVGGNNCVVARIRDSVRYGAPEIATWDRRFVLVGVGEFRKSKKKNK